MSRFPTIGGDPNNWGTVLQDYANQAHNADGTLKPSAVSNAIVPGQAHTGWLCSGTINETQLASVLIPSNTIGLGSVEVISLWSMTNTVNNKTFRVRFGTANNLTGTVFLATIQTATNTMQTFQSIRNKTTSSQIGWASGAISGFTVSAGSLVTTFFDTTQPTWVVFSGQLASTSDTLQLESYIVKAYPG